MSFVAYFRIDKREAYEVPTQKERGPIEDSSLSENKAYLGRQKIAATDRRKGSVDIRDFRRWETEGVGGLRSKL